MIVPFSSVKYEYDVIAPELKGGLKRLVDCSAFVLGEEVARTEKALADYLGLRRVIGVGSGTDALYLSLVAARIGNGDEVLLVGNICVAVMEAVVRAGAVPVFVDILPGVFSVDTEQARKAITPMTKALVVVHPYGMPADIELAARVADDRGIILIEACGQSFGAKYRGRTVGSFGTISCFSFNPGKLIGGLGDGGAVATNDDSIAERVRKLRDHGRAAIGADAEMIGISSRLDAINALAVRLKLAHIDEWVELRQEKALYYQNLLRDIDIMFQNNPGGRVSSYQMFVVLSPKNRYALAQELAKKGIETSFHYRRPPYRMPAFRHHLCRCVGSLPVTEELYARSISLPFYTGITEKEIVLTVATLQKIITNEFR